MVYTIVEMAHQDAFYDGFMEPGLTQSTTAWPRGRPMPGWRVPRTHLLPSKYHVLLASAHLPALEQATTATVVPAVHDEPVRNAA